MPKVIACGYEIDLDELIPTLAITQMSFPAGQTLKMGLYYGTGSVGAPIVKEDADIRKWAEEHQAPVTLTLKRLLIRGMVVGEFVDQDGVSFLGVLLNPKGIKVMQAMKEIDQFAKCAVRPVRVSARPYLW